MALYADAGDGEIYANKFLIVEVWRTVARTVCMHVDMCATIQPTTTVLLLEICSHLQERKIYRSANNV